MKNKETIKNALITFYRSKEPDQQLNWVLEELGLGVLARDKSLLTHFTESEWKVLINKRLESK